MSRENFFEVAVIGAGASGAVVAAQFRRLAPPHARLALIGHDETSPRGVAYDTPYESFLLNVPAWNMSAIAQDMDHFVNWLTARDSNADRKTFASRIVYGDYLTDLLNEALYPPGPITPIRARAVNLSQRENGWTIHLDDGSAIEALRVVLAVGNLPPNNPPEIGDRAIPNYFSNPWSPDIAGNLDVGAPMLMIGTGLTMVDAVLALRERNHRGHIYALSRHGRLFQTHAAFTPRPLQTLPDDFRTPGGALRWIRKEIKIAESEGNNWRAVIDSLRPHIAKIWQGWTQAQRATFLRHGRNEWDIHRHRMPPQVAAQLHALIAGGTLSIHHGRIVSVYVNTNDTTVQWQPHSSRALHQVHVARIINCTGPNRDYARVNTPLIASLRNAGWLTPDPFQLGWVTDKDGRLIGANGNVTDGLFTLGPLRIADLWESIAMPEIRVQAAELAKLLAAQAVAEPLA